MSALEVANRVRQLDTRVRNTLKARDGIEGREAAAELLRDWPDDDGSQSSLTVEGFLFAITQVRRSRTAAYCRELYLRPSKRVRDLTERQRLELAAVLEKDAASMRRRGTDRTNGRHR